MRPARLPTGILVKCEAQPDATHRVTEASPLHGADKVFLLGEELQIQHTLDEQQGTPHECVSPHTRDWLRHVWIAKHCVSSMLRCELVEALHTQKEAPHWIAALAAARVEEAFAGHQAHEARANDCKPDWAAEQLATQDGLGVVDGANRTSPTEGPYRLDGVEGRDHVSGVLPEVGIALQSKGEGRRRCNFKLEE